MEGTFAAFLKARATRRSRSSSGSARRPFTAWVKGSGKALWGIDPVRWGSCRFLPDVPEVREDFADYLGEAQAFDAYIGTLLKQLKDAGELDNTLVVISGDHGPPGFPRGKWNLYDFGTGVALVAAGPGVPGPRVVDDFVNLMDLAPTFLEAGGVKRPDGMNGKSLWPVLTSKNTDRPYVPPTSSPAMGMRSRARTARQLSMLRRPRPFTSCVMIASNIDEPPTRRALMRVESAPEADILSISVVIV